MSCRRQRVRENFPHLDKGLKLSPLGCHWHVCELLVSTAFNSVNTISQRLTSSVVEGCCRSVNPCPRAWFSLTSNPNSSGSESCLWAAGEYSVFGDEAQMVEEGVVNENER